MVVIRMKHIDNGCQLDEAIDNGCHWDEAHWQWFHIKMPIDNGSH